MASGRATPRERIAAMRASEDEPTRKERAEGKTMDRRNGEVRVGRGAARAKPESEGFPIAEESGGVRANVH